jgi:hypothetical protein
MMTVAAERTEYKKEQFTCQDDIFISIARATFTFRLWWGINQVIALTSGPCDSLRSSHNTAALDFG